MAEDSNCMMIIDETYEFSAPVFFDFMNGESEEDRQKAELWFESSLSYAPSPFMHKPKASRSFKVETLCNFNDAVDQVQKDIESSDSIATGCPSDNKPQSEHVPSEPKVETMHIKSKIEKYEVLGNPTKKEEDSLCRDKTRASLIVESEPTNNKENVVPHGLDVCTPKPETSQKGERITDSKKNQSAKKIANMIRNPSSLKPKNQLHSSSSNVKSIKSASIKPTSVKRDPKAKTISGTPNLAQRYQAIKRQKLEGGESRKILNIKPQNFPHKTKAGLVNSSSNLSLSTAKQTQTPKENRKKIYVREQVPFVSMAEMMKKFQSSTRDLSLPGPHARNSSMFQGGAASNVQNKPKLTLTMPKEPAFETSQRVRAVKVKSTAELEEEMMANIPKFKARPVNKKILEAPSVPALQRRTPHIPEFQEFHLRTMERANENAETSSVTTTELCQQKWKPHLSEPKPPVLQTSLRARPVIVKSTLELEQEELEKVPKFKARPLNKKIFESKGELGIFCNAKKHVTEPQEFHFATSERVPPPPPSVFDLFDKLSLNSEKHDKPLPRNTRLNPFNLHTEERGAEKTKKFVMEVIQKHVQDERARIPKASPYPYTTDYPVIPPKPEPKLCTRPEPFQLESLVRHEEEMQREMEERLKMEKEMAHRRLFKAQPILKQDPMPVPEKVRKPLTEVQRFDLHADNRAVIRAEFDQKIKEKEMMYKRYREESDSIKMMEEEKALKQLRRTMVPHARPVPKFDYPFCPQKSTKEITKAKSPKLRVLQRNERRKMVTPNVATSSPATHMR